MVSRSLRVLLVGDNEADTERLLGELQRGGYDPDCLRVDAAPAMRAALAQPDWDLVIADYTLSRFSGLAALQLVQERGLHVPFIIMSGSIDEETAVAAVKAGADDYLLKGNLTRLLPMVERCRRDAAERQARRNAEAALQASELRFRSLIENMSGLVALLDPNGAICYQSPSVEPILGYTADSLVGSNLTRYTHPDDLPLVQAFLEELMGRPGVLLPVEFRVRHQDGSWRVLGAMGRNLIDNPGIQGIVLNARDITDRRQLEDQLRQSQKMEAIGRLAGGVAHDFNNMLGAIIGYTDLLLHRLSADAGSRELLQEVMNAGERAGRLTRQLLAFSRKEVLAPRELDLNELLLGTHQMLDRLIGEDIELTAVPADTPAWVSADPGQLEQLILNLAVNSRDAMPQGGKLALAVAPVAVDDFTARLHPGVAPGAYVRLSVCDTGCGIDAETQRHIFEPFFTTKGPGAGTGLGLATVYGIVQQSGGHIRVESQLGQGAAFHIYLPCCEPAVAAPAAELPATPAAAAGTILLVEDEAIVRGMVHKGLSLFGYEVLVAGRGEEAMQFVEQRATAIDLLLTDVVMPGMSGRELAEQATRLRPSLKVLLMSGYTDDAIVRHGVMDAELAFIQKPFTLAALADKLQDVMAVD
jgi:two-component system cell cycle sensor histidine kinase/response regulator CckA